MHAIAVHYLSLFLSTENNAQLLKENSPSCQAHRCHLYTTTKWSKIVAN